MIVSSYRVEVERDGRFWLIHIPAINRSTQARARDEIPIMASDLIQAMTGEDAADIHLHTTFAESQNAE